MKRLIVSILIFSVMPIFAVNSIRNTDEHGLRFRPDQASYRLAAKQVKAMSLEEKLGQLIHIGVNAKFLNQDDPEYLSIRKQINEQKIGGIVIFAGGIYETVHFLNRMQDASKLPLLISADFETGVGMRFSAADNFPWNMAVAATGKPDFAERLGFQTAEEALALGVQQVFAPVVDVNNNAGNPVINVRSFGEDPKLVAEYGKAFTRGLQKGNVLATAKHFPGHGDTDVDSHRGLPVIDLDRERLSKVELYPFHELIKAGVGSVMVSHISMPKIDGEVIRPLFNAAGTFGDDEPVETAGTTIPATLSKPIVTGILRNELGFDGLIVTDAMDMNGLTLFFDQKEAAVRAVEAGNDVLLKPASAKEAISGLREAVESKRLPIDVIDKAVTRQLAWKHRLGLFKNRQVSLDAIDRKVSGAATRQLASEVANGAITLVKHDGKSLPLAKGRKVVVLAITNGKDFEIVGRPFLRSLTSAGIDASIVAIDERSGIEDINKARLKIAEADTVIAGLFGRVRSGAKNSVSLPDAGNSLLSEVLQGEQRVITVAFGNPYLLNAFPEIKNYIVAYGDMESLQIAAANGLTGRIEFRGKLPITVGDFPAGTGLTITR